jgi:hemerythrin-like domain-containing protein
MSEPSQPNVAADLVRIHSVVTRGLKVSIERSQAFAQGGFPDDTTRQGFVDYVQSLVSVLHAHHLGEDELAFPYLRELLPDAPFDLLSEQHQHMLPILDKIKAASEAVAVQEPKSQPLNDLKRALTEIADLWQPHIQIEEEHFSVEKGAELISVDEHIRLAQLFAKLSQEHAQPDYLVVPFILYNLAPEDRAIMAGAMPPMVTQELVPKVWKEKWAPMQPFLLD